MGTKTKPRYWAGSVGLTDDFGVQIRRVFIDGKTLHGPWGIMTPTSWREHGVGRLGSGLGQRYEQQADGRWLKTEG